jgi:hypothetical protein
MPHGHPLRAYFQIAQRFFIENSIPVWVGGRPDMPLSFINIGSLFPTRTDTYSFLSLIVTEKNPVGVQLHGDQ